MRRLIGALVVAAAAATGEQPPDPSALLTRLEGVLLNGSPDAYLHFIDPSADRRRAEAFGQAEVRPGATRAVVRERDRQAIDSPSGDGLRLMVDTFVEFGDRARAATWTIDVHRADEGWRIIEQERLSSVESLYRLSLDTSRRFRARNFMVKAEDLDLALVDGFVYRVYADDQLTGLVLVGRGEMRFRPEPQIERRQVEIFAGRESLDSRFDAAFVRAADLAAWDLSPLVEAPVDEGERDRAVQTFRAESMKTYVLDLGDLSPEAWSQLPGAGEFVAEVATRRFGPLTYVRAPAEDEDIQLFNRPSAKTISVYRSRARVAEVGRFSSVPTPSTFDILDYDVDIAYEPARLWIDGRATLRVRINGQAFVGQITLRLADSLVVQEVVSAEFGRLFSMRVRGQNQLIVNMPGGMVPGTQFRLTVAYGGRLDPQPADREAMLLGSVEPAAQSRALEPMIADAEPTYLYSGRSLWYPQHPAGGYATARLRISVPSGLACLATGAPSEVPARPLTGPAAAPDRHLYAFTAERPVRYLAFLVGRFTIAERVTVDFEQGTATIDGGAHQSIGLAVAAQPRVLDGRGVDRVARVARFYQSVVGDAPYDSFTLALVESAQPGGHSPAHFATLTERPPSEQVVWRNDPAYFPVYPDFFLAHEVAHQWWGQGVGWQNYHEQWLSEGIAQYFAALYAAHDRGPAVFGELLGQMRRSALGRSDQGPVFLGVRLGHVRNDGAVFRALVYNKSAVVLHMLRRLIGDEPFFRGTRRFYAAGRYEKATTDDLRDAMEMEAGGSLERFFDRWIRDAALPRLTYAYQIRSTPHAEVTIRIEQSGDVFDIPVTFTLEYADRTTEEVVVPVREASVETRHPLRGALRSLRVNERDGTLADLRRVSY
jgi:hypothetical protein